MADGVVEWKPGSEDPDAIDKMFKLAIKSRERWLPDTGWSAPGLVPVAAGEPAEG